MSIIKFQVLYPNSKPNQWGSKEDPSCYVSLNHPDTTMFYIEEEGKTKEVPANILNGDEVVIPKDSIQVHFSYPLGNPETFTLNADTELGFTRKGLAKKISEKYHQIYEEERETSEEPEETYAERSERLGGPKCYLVNRVNTCGKFGDMYWKICFCTQYMKKMEFII